MRFTWLRRSESGWSVPLAAVLVLAAPAALLAQRGTVTGRVRAAGSEEPLADARVMLVNTSISGATGADGRYTLRGVPSGNQQIRILRVGYQEQKKPIVVPPGG